MKQVLIYNVWWPSWVYYIGALLTGLLAIHDFAGRASLGGVFLFFTCIGLIVFGWRNPKERQTLMSISTEGIWTRKRGNKSWEKIKFVQFRAQGRQIYLDIYVSNELRADEEIPMRDLGVSQLRLWWLLRRFGKEKFQ